MCCSGRTPSSGMPPRRWDLDREGVARFHPSFCETEGCGRWCAALGNRTRCCVHCPARHTRACMDRVSIQVRGWGQLGPLPPAEPAEPDGGPEAAAPAQPVDGPPPPPPPSQSAGSASTPARSAGSASTPARSRSPRSPDVQPRDRGPGAVIRNLRANLARRDTEYWISRWEVVQLREEARRLRHEVEMTRQHAAARSREHWQLLQDLLRDLERTPDGTNVRPVFTVLELRNSVLARLAQEAPGVEERRPAASAAPEVGRGCPVCMEDGQTLVYSYCDHGVCGRCWAGMSAAGLRSCPICRAAWNP